MVLVRIVNFVDRRDAWPFKLYFPSCAGTLLLPTHLNWPFLLVLLENLCVICAKVYERCIVGCSLSRLRVLAAVYLAHRLLLLDFRYLIQVVLIAALKGVIWLGAEIVVIGFALSQDSFV